MTKRMLIDAAHPEESRVVVLDGNRLVEFDYETSTKKQIKGNIYLAKVTRVEPSLQAAFVEYGGNRHGFLAFNEIHPDYYRIPMADREAAIEAERVAEAAENQREEEREEAGLDVPVENHDAAALDAPHPELASEPLDAGDHPPEIDASEPAPFDQPDADHGDGDASITDVESLPAPLDASESVPTDAEPFAEGATDAAARDPSATTESTPTGEAATTPTSVETLGGDEIEEARRPIRRPFRHYKIQEVIKRRQIMLVQVTKEERGNKGAALTTYISLAGRYCVLMPNTPRGGGVSRKITSANDRRRLKELMSGLEVPEGMGVIVRTAGSERSKPEIGRDFEYLRRLWDDIRELTLKSTAPALIYEEGNIIKRAIRDLYSRDLEEIVVDGEAGYHNARAFMQMLMPDDVRRVKLYRDPSVPLFQRYPIEGQLDAIHSPTVQLKSGGYVVINPTEALVSIDVNSGRSTRERNIEETATKTNLEAADEIARQLRLRDLAGLIVIDFIDMEVSRNQHAVERRLKEAMRQDRARIQIGRISPFGLLEMSRQRLRPSLLETSTQPCPHCGGTGHIRSTESTALHVLRAIEEEGVRRRSAEVTVSVPEAVGLYILNQKRTTLQQVEARCGMHVSIKTDATLIPPQYKLERMRALTPAEVAALPVTMAPAVPVDAESADVAGAADETATGTSETFAEPMGDREPAADHGHGGDHQEQSQGESGGRRRRGRRGRRGGRGRHHGNAPSQGGESQPGGEPHHAAPQPPAERSFRPSFALLPGEPGYVAGGSDEEVSDNEPPQPDSNHDAAQFGAEPQPGHEGGGQPGHGDDGRRRRRRGRRGGRRRRGRGGERHDESMAGNAGPDIAEHETASAAPQAAHAAPPVEAPLVPPPPRAANPEPKPEPTPVETERQPIQHNAPPAHEITGPASNPKKGWWRR